MDWNEEQKDLPRQVVVMSATVRDAMTADAVDGVVAVTNQLSYPR